MQTLRFLVLENLIKNIFLVVLGLLLYVPLRNELAGVTTDQLGNFLLIVSILLVTVCFANFAFTYEKVHADVTWWRFLAHLTTFIFLLLTALLLEAMVIIVGNLYPPLHSFTLWISVLLYAGVALFDIWDYLRLYKT